MKFDFTEEFQKLSHSPIVEAVIDFRAKPSVPCDQAGFETYFKTEFHDFSALKIQNQFEPTQPRGHWQGLVFYSSGNLKIVQCQRDGFSFSRLQPYDNWEAFAGEALSLWEKYARLTKPVEIQRLGVRFINRIVVKPEWPLPGDYLVNAPQSLNGTDFPLASFLHNNTYSVPEHNYLINLNLASQPAEGANLTPAIIIDIDVFTTNTMTWPERKLEMKLKEMRWLKNKIFFDSLSAKLLKSLQ